MVLRYTRWEIAKSKIDCLIMRWRRLKKELMALKERKSMPQDLRTWHIISLINKSWVSSFDWVNKNNNTIANRGWIPLNGALLADPDIFATMTDKDRETNEASENIILPDTVVCGVIDLSTDSPTYNLKYLVSEASRTDYNINSR